MVEVAFIIFMKLCAEPRLFCKDSRPQLLTVLYDNSNMLDKEKHFKITNQTESYSAPKQQTVKLAADTDVFFSFFKVKLHNNGNGVLS